MGSVKEKIEKRAYELFLARGGKQGYAIDDWLKAEREIQSQSREPNSSPVNRPKKGVWK